MTLPVTNNPYLFKENWLESRERFIKWWNRDDFLVGSWCAPKRATSHDASIRYPERPHSMHTYYHDVNFRVQANHWSMANGNYGLDILPIADTAVGPGSLALYLGSDAHLAEKEGTVWYPPIWKDCTDVLTLPELKLDRDCYWWKKAMELLKKSTALAEGLYMVGCEDLIENLDIVAALRDPQTVMLDLIENPDWLKQKIREVNVAWFEAYQAIYDIIKAPDGGTVFWAFMIWGPGKTAKVQCDACAMISPAMFEEFVLPSLTEQCQWLDYSMYHLDGSQCMDKVNLLLSIEALDAIEWTPEPTKPSGGDPYWYPFYRKIIEAGKSVQAVGVKPHEVVPLINAVGTKGIYILAELKEPEALEAVAAQVRQFR